MNEENKDLEYWKNNCEEDYIITPISVLRYITKLETAVKNCSTPLVSKCPYCDSTDIDKEEKFCNNCSEYID